MKLSLSSKHLIKNRLLTLQRHNVSVPNTKLWLEKLIECMEFNNAGIVGPVYLWKKNKIHMYGGDANITNNNFSERHYLVDQDKNILHQFSFKTPIIIIINTI